MAMREKVLYPSLQRPGVIEVVLLTQLVVLFPLFQFLPIWVTMICLGVISYRFLVKASNKDGVWNNEGAFVSLTVTPPIWETKSAYMLYVLSLALMLSVVRFFLNSPHSSMPSSRVPLRFTRGWP